MNTLYSDLSEIYEGMYQTFINYDEEFEFYFKVLKKYHCRSVLEVGCGTGNLAQCFRTHQFDYVGLDLSDDMLRIAKKNNPGSTFLKGDMRNFTLQKHVESCIITGRSISYVTSDEDVKNAFASIGKNLTSLGILCFDFIDASKFIPSIKDGKTIMHEAIVHSKKYRRESFWKVNLAQDGLFDWESVFYEEQTDDSLKRIGEDQSTIRAFWADEIKTFLEIGGFKVEEIILCF